MIRSAGTQLKQRDDITKSLAHFHIESFSINTFICKQDLNLLFMKMDSVVKHLTLYVHSKAIKGSME